MVKITLSFYKSVFIMQGLVSSRVLEDFVMISYHFCMYTNSIYELEVYPWLALFLNYKQCKHPRKKFKEKAAYIKQCSKNHLIEFNQTNSTN